VHYREQLWLSLLFRTQDQGLHSKLPHSPVRRPQCGGVRSSTGSSSDLLSLGDQLREGALCGVFCSAEVHTRLCAALVCTQQLCELYPGHQSVWYHRRFLLAAVCSFVPRHPAGGERVPEREHASECVSERPRESVCGVPGKCVSECPSEGVSERPRESVREVCSESVRVTVRNMVAEEADRCVASLGDARVASVRLRPQSELATSHLLWMIRWDHMVRSQHATATATATATYGLLSEAHLRSLRWALVDRLHGSERTTSAHAAQQALLAGCLGRDEM
jgi:Protein prenyltransferase alpha subunit repeat